MSKRRGKRRSGAWLCHAAAILLAAPLSLPLAAQAQDATIGVPADDPEMRAAIAEARRGLPVFFGHATAPGPDEKRFIVKYDVVPEDRVEYAWAEIVSHGGDVTIARLLNATQDPRWRRGDMVTIRDTQIVDWAYFRGPTMIGGATMRVLLGRVSPEEAATLRERFGWE